MGWLKLTSNIPGIQEWLDRCAELIEPEVNKKINDFAIYGTVDLASGPDRTILQIWPPE